MRRKGFYLLCVIDKLHSKLYEQLKKLPFTGVCFQLNPVLCRIKFSYPVQQ